MKQILLISLLFLFGTAAIGQQSYELAPGTYFNPDGKYPITAVTVSSWAGERVLDSRIRYKTYHRDHTGRIVLVSKWANLQGELLQVDEDTYITQTSYTTIGLNICTMPISITLKQRNDGLYVKFRQPHQLDRYCQIVGGYQTIRIPSRFIQYQP